MHLRRTAMAARAGEAPSCAWIPTLLWGGFAFDLWGDVVAWQVSSRGCALTAKDASAGRVSASVSNQCQHLWAWPPGGRSYPSALSIKRFSRPWDKRRDIAHAHGGALAMRL